MASMLALVVISILLAVVAVKVVGVPTTIDEQWSAGEILSNTAIYDRAEVLRWLSLFEAPAAS